MPNNQIRALTQGAIMLALFLVLFAIAMYIPLLMVPAFLIAPLPIAWYSANFERKQAILVGVLGVFSGFLMGGLLGPFLALILVASGIVIGDGIREKKSKLYVFLTTGVAVLLTFALLFVIMTKLFNVNFITEGLELLEEAYTESAKIVAEQTGGEFPMERLTETFTYMEMMVPSSITLSVFLFSFMMVSIAYTLFNRLGMAVQKFGKFSSLRMPKAILWYYLIVLTVNLFVQPEHGSNLEMVMLNFSVVLWVLLTIQGVSLLFYAIEAFNYPKLLKVLAVLISFPMYSLVLLIGIIDLGFNIREYIDGKSQGRS